jgi:hypothetical protein
MPRVDFLYIARRFWPHHNEIYVSLLLGTYRYETIVEYGPVLVIGCLITAGFGSRLLLSASYWSSIQSRCVYKAKRRKKTRKDTKRHAKRYEVTRKDTKRHA